MKTWKAIASAALVSVCLVACSEGDEDVSAGPDLTTAPEATWQDSSGVKRPESTSGHCPNKTGEFAVEHEQTPQCAVIAAMSGQVLLATTGDQEWPMMANSVLAAGPGKDQWVQSRTLMSVSGRVADPARFVGFKFTDYSDEKAQVLLAVQWPDQKVTAQPVQLVWQNTAWRLVLPTQEEAVDAVELPNLDGFTSFGPGE